MHDIHDDEPSWEYPEAKALRERNFVRINDPRKIAKKADPDPSEPASPTGTSSVPEEDETGNPYRLQFPDQKFGTILADPPWRLKTGGVKRKLHYDTMSLDDIKNMAIDIDEVTYSDSHLWLWATNPQLPEAFEVMQAWGFTYKSMITWDKERMGLGWWLRSQTEHILFGVRTNKNRVQPSKITTLIREKRRAHSVKPDAIIPIIETLSPGPYLELFARAPRKGWTCLVSNEKPRGDAYGQG